MIPYTQWAIRTEGYKRILIGYNEQRRLWEDVAVFSSNLENLARHIADLCNLQT